MVAVVLLAIIDFSWSALLVLALIGVSTLFALVSIEKNARQIRHVIRNQRHLTSAVSEIVLGSENLAAKIEALNKVSISSNTDLIQSFNQTQDLRDKKNDQILEFVKNTSLNLNELNSKENQFISSLNSITSEHHKNEIRLRQIATLVKEIHLNGNDSQVIQQKLGILAKNKDLNDLSELVLHIKTEQHANQLRLRQIGQLTRSVELMLSEAGDRTEAENNDKVLESSRREVTFKILEDLCEIRYILESDPGKTAESNEQR
ncbi:hypothetical protein ACTXJE_17960 [Glutamicibacter ardleyensis]